MSISAPIIDTSYTWQYYLVMAAVVTIPGIVAFIGVVAFRKKPRRRIRRHRSNYHSGAAPINPTLNRAGGLPPIRSEEDLTNQLKS